MDDSGNTPNEIPVHLKIVQTDSRPGMKVTKKTCVNGIVVQEDGEGRSVMTAQVCQCNTMRVGPDSIPRLQVGFTRQQRGKFTSVITPDGQEEPKLEIEERRFAIV